MKTLLKRIAAVVSLASALNAPCFSQTALTWQQVRDRFEASNPTLRAAQVAIDESHAQEITAFLRPNPNLSVSLDQVNPFTTDPLRPLTFALPLGIVTYLHERDHKRELRLESAKEGTEVTRSQSTDTARILIFNLRTAFIQMLQQKAVFALAAENLTYYDHLLDINRERYNAGAIAQVDLDRLELQRVTYESDLQTADVNLRTAKIQLLALLNDRTPVDQFDVTGSFDFSTQLPAPDEVRNAAIDTRPDLRAALQSVDKAKTDHRLAIANGSTDPTFSVDFGRNPPIPVYFGVGVSIPLRIFDKNQGEKLRTQLDINRSARLADATRAQVLNDVDSAYAVLNSTIILLKPYKERYLPQASRVRETISFSYQHGAASLLDFLNAQAEYRSVQLNYLDLIGSYMQAASQLNMAVGREVIP